MDLCYYPGCTLKTKAKNFEDSAIAAMSALDINMIELPRWNCCGTVYSLADDDLIHHVAGVRTLIRVKEQGYSNVVTLCSFCYNTLARANLLMRNDKEKRYTLNSFMEEEMDFEGEIEVKHLLQVLKDNVDEETIASRIKTSLQDLKVAAYYGCTLLRPADVAIDNVEQPAILQKLLTTLGATVVDFPFATECCGSFQVVSNPDLASERAYSILNMASRQGADILVVSCPLCNYNLGRMQDKIVQTHNDFQPVPIIFFTQLMALAFGTGQESYGFEQNYGNAVDLLKHKGFI